MAPPENQEAAEIERVSICESVTASLVPTRSAYPVVLDGRNVRKLSKSNNLLIICIF